MKNYSFGFLSFFGIGSNDKTEFLAMTLHHDKKSDIFTIFILLFNYLESWEPWIFIDPNMWIKVKSKNNLCSSRNIKKYWKSGVHVIFK